MTLKAFGELFVENNRNKCYILNERIRYNLNTYFNIISLLFKGKEIKIILNNKLYLLHYLCSI